MAYLAGTQGNITVAGVTYNQITPALGQALSSGQPVYVNGVPVQVSQFMGGFLINGCPLNVVLGQGWLPGQQDALRQANITTCLDAVPSTPSAITAPVSALNPTNISITGNTSPIPGSTLVPSSASGSGGGFPVGYDTSVNNDMNPASQLSSGLSPTVLAIGALALIFLLRK